MTDQIIIIILLGGFYGLIPVMLLLIQREWEEVTKMQWYLLGIMSTLLIGMIHCWFGMGPQINISNPIAAAIASMAFSSMTLFLSLILLAFVIYQYVQNGVYMYSSEA